MERGFGRVTNAATARRLRWFQLKLHQNQFTLIVFDTRTTAHIKGVPVHPAPQR
jgi:hypothetical protein